jgi:type VI secretion system protein ImpH
MATQGQRAAASLKEKLFQSGYDFDFFQAVHLLSRIYSNREPVGHDATPGDEIVRFGAHASMEFPASQIHEIYEKENGQPAMTVSFLGLTGPKGILPSHYTELVLSRIASSDGALARFLDIFNHRLLSLFYRAWEKHHFAVGYEREQAGQKGADRFTSYLFALIGMQPSALRGRLPIPDLALLRYGGLIAQRPQSASALAAILSDYFGLPVHINQFVGKWLTIDQASLSFLDGPGQHDQLGFGAIAGDAVWDRQSNFRVRVGPVGIEQFLAFLPDQPGYRVLIELTRYLAGTVLEFEVQLVLKAAEVPHCKLTDEAADAPRLGWLGWLKTDEFQEDASDATFVGALAT